MNKVILMGRLTGDPDVRYSAGDNSKAYARFRIAVDRRFNRTPETTADFFNCVAFGRNAEFAEKYLRKGIKIVLTGRLETGSYTNRDGQKVNTVDVVVDELEFAESKAASDSYGAGRDSYGGGYGSDRPSMNASAAPAPDQAAADGFMNIPDGIEEELPFI